MMIFYRFNYLLFFLFLYISLFTLSSNPKYITVSDNYHIVKKSDTLDKISDKYNISKKKLFLYNDLKSEKIFPGQKIYLEPKLPLKNEFVTVRSIPSKKYHLVEKGETLTRISKMYDIYIFDLVDFNDLTGFNVEKGQKIWLVPQKNENNIITTENEQVTQINPEKIIEKKVLSRQNILHENKEIDKGDKNLFLPLKGIVTSEFGMRNGRPHKGIDIAAPTGEPIFAALKGEVVFSGTQRGYGNVIILKHVDKIMTVYAHNETNLVRIGDKVKKGQPIATVGKTGNTTGSHLHFEYRKNGKAINPRRFLPLSQKK